MIIFWCGAAFALCIGLLIIWLPMIRQRKVTLPAIDIRRQTNIALYQQQIAFANKQFSNKEKHQGLLDELEQELSLSLLQDIETKDKPNSVAAGNVLLIFPVLMTLVLLIIPVMGFIGFGQYHESVDYTRQGNSDPFVGMEVEQIQDRVISELHQRIRQSPSDSDAWFMLGQRYLNSNEFENALIAFERVTMLRGNDAEVITAKATTFYYQAGQRMTPQAKMLIEQALTLEPNQVTALMLLASDYFLNAQYQQAIDIWQQLLDSNNPQINRAKLIEAINMARMMK